MCNRPTPNYTFKHMVGETIFVGFVILILASATMIGWMLIS